MSERPILFSCEGEPLVGVLHAPGAPASLGVLIVVGGPQYRVGSHRQFVSLGRELARAGFACFRFDYRGMGDSAAPQRDFDAVRQDIRAAIDVFLAECPRLEGVVLWGLCDGASAALLYAASDSRVAGAVAVNPWVRSEATLAQARIGHYYRRRLLDPDMWRKLLSGRFEWRRSVTSASASLWRVVRSRTSPRRSESAGRAKTFQDRMADGWRHLGKRALFVLSGNDLTAAEFRLHVKSSSAWRGFPSGDGGNVRNVPDADHTFSRTEWRARLAAHTVDWMADLQSRHIEPSLLVPGRGAARHNE